MKIGLPKGIVLSLFVVSGQLHAINFQQYANHVSAHIQNETDNATVLGIIDSCGNSASLDSHCVMQGLERVTTEESNALAQAIATDYEKALTEGKYSKVPECQTETNLQVNRNIGHCIILMHYYELKNLDPEAAILQYETCLQGGMIGLAYQGNLVAQHLLSDIFKHKGAMANAAFWAKTFEKRKGTEDYIMAKKCYG